ncbi:nucleoside phosphorylase domain-containing protein [Neurospora intermedia]|uniref:Nucleoside phosphorylase domain-containing protein n=1 Tax=Neurospora intermedia TaxID=5142 RepID=A0ABR3D1M9_NEUIN
MFSRCFEQRTRLSNSKPMEKSSIHRPDGFDRPNGRSDFEVAIICALAREFDAVCLLIDEFWNEYNDQFGKVQGNHNIYTTERLGTCNVVVVQLSDMGKAMAASAAASLRSSYPQVSLALLVGVCGAVPFRGSGPEMTTISLGDVIISDIVVQYDLGRVLTDRFVRKNTAHDDLRRPNKTIRNILASLGGSRVQDQIEQRAGIFLKHLQGKANTKASRNRRRSHANYQYPGAVNDRLFQPWYRHKHRSGSGCVICEGCLSDEDPACGESLKLSCEELGCDVSCLIPREHLQSTLDDPDSESPEGIFFHVGAIGSGDAVIRSGKRRDQIAAEASVIAFEMEGAGVWDELPCIVIKDVCDYADSHKNKGWQNYAAATAASVAKAVIEKYIAPATVSNSLQSSDSIDLGGRQDTQRGGGGTGGSAGGMQFNGSISGSKFVVGNHRSGGTTNIRFA